MIFLVFFLQLFCIKLYKVLLKKRIFLLLSLQENRTTVFPFFFFWVLFLLYLCMDDWRMLGAKGFLRLTVVHSCSRFSQKPHLFQFSCPVVWKMRCGEYLRLFYIYFGGVVSVCVRVYMCIYSYVSSHKEFIPSQLMKLLPRVSNGPRFFSTPSPPAPAPVDGGVPCLVSHQKMCRYTLCSYVHKAKMSVTEHTKINIDISNV